MENNKEIIEQEKTVEQQEEKVVVEVSVKYFEDGNIQINLSREDINIEIIENMLKKSYEIFHDKRIVEMALEAFKNKLAQ